MADGLLANNACTSPDSLGKLTVAELKDYLRQRDLNLSGNKSELCEKVFYADKLGIVKIPERKDEQNSKTKSRDDKLLVENGLIKLPPPDSIKEGWQSGSTNLPDTTENDVQSYLKNTPKAILKGKSLEYSGHLYKVECHAISPNLKYCFVRGKCVPQERTHNNPYEVWVCLHKESGEVITAECNCVAGLGEVCKHVGALLHHIASEVGKGNNKTCTSKPQTWAQPSAGAKRKYGPKKLSEIRIKKAKNKASSVPNTRENTKVDRSTFDPRCLKDRAPMTFTDTDWQNLALATNGSCGILLYKNPFSDSHQEPDICHVVQEEIVLTEIVEEPVPLLCQAYTIAQVYPTLDEQCEQLVSQLAWSKEQSDLIAKQSEGQSTNSIWSLYRTGIITASRMLSVLRKTDNDGRVSNKPSTDNLTIQILGYNKQVKTKAMNWGLINEPLARKKYKTISQKCHSNFTISETGLVLSPDWPHVGASPDGVVHCSCCGPGAVELKTTWAHREKTMREFALVQGTCLHVHNEGVALKCGHEYFHQVQTVMAVLKVPYIDFFLMSSVDEHLERIAFNSRLWEDTLPRLFSFFRHCIVPEMFTNRLLKQVIVKEVLMEIINKVV